MNSCFYIAGFLSLPGDWNETFINLLVVVLCAALLMSSHHSGGMRLRLLLPGAKSAHSLYKPVSYFRRLAQWLKEAGDVTMRTGTHYVTMLLALWASHFVNIFGMFRTELDWFKQNQKVHLGIAISLLMFCSLVEFIRQFHLARRDHRVSNVRNRGLTHFAAITKKMNDAEEQDAPDSELAFRPRHSHKRIVVRSILNFLFECGVAENCANVTVLIKPEFGRATWYHSYHEPCVTAETLMEQPSAARSCLEGGTHLFLTSKVKATTEGQYYPDVKDKEFEDGSCFVYPFVLQDRRSVVITISVYGTRLCGQDGPVFQEYRRTFQHFCELLSLELRRECMG